MTTMSHSLYTFHPHTKKTLVGNILLVQMLRKYVFALNKITSKFYLFNLTRTHY